MSILEIKGLTHMFDNKTLFADANLNVNNGEHIGVVGLNGAGKSTFINILAGKIVQDSGEVNWNSSVSKGYLDQHADIERNQTVMEYLKTAFDYMFVENERMEKLYESMSDISDADELDRIITKANNIMERLNHNGFFELDASIKKVANGLGLGNVGYDTSVSTLSGGQRAKLMLAKLLLTKPDLMLLDEPTNFLDIEHIEWLCGFLSSHEGTFLVISHDTDFLDKICKIIVSIENGIIRKYTGDYSSFLVQAEQNMRQYEDSYNRQQREIERMTDYINRNKARASTAGMANSRKKMLDRMDVIKKPTVIYDAEFSFPYTELHTKHLLTLDKLQIGYGAPLLPPISLELSSESKLWIRGTNGIGKSTLIKTILSQLKNLGGSFEWHDFAQIGYLEQELNFNECTELNAVNYISNLFPKLDSKALRGTLAKVGIKNDLATKPLCDLSGGEQVRVKLCALGQKKTNVLVLDEPTNHLDVRAKDALQKALEAYPGALILVSHERSFAETLCPTAFDAVQ